MFNKSKYFILLFFLSHAVIAEQVIHLELKDVLSSGVKKSLDSMQSENQVEVSKIELEHSGRWDNPEIELDSNSKVSREIGGKKMALSSIAISQSIPLFKTSAKKEVAQANYDVAKLLKLNTDLEVQKRLSETYYEVQYHKAQLDLQSTKLTKISETTNRTKGKVVHFISQLDKKRLQIIKQNNSLEREQSLDTFRRSVVELKTILDMDLAQKLSFEPLQTKAILNDLSFYLDKVDSHPYLLALKQKQKHSDASLRLNKLNHFGDPVLRIYRDNDFLNDVEQTNVGASLSISLPLWGGREAEVVSELKRKRALVLGHKIALRSYQGRVKHAYLTLKRQIALEKQYRESVLKDAKDLLERTIKKFKTGNASILSLIDVYESYFSYHASYLDIVYDMNKKIANLNYYSATKL